MELNLPKCRTKEKNTHFWGIINQSGVSGMKNRGLKMGKNMGPLNQDFIFNAERVMESEDAAGKETSRVHVCQFVCFRNRSTFRFFLFFNLFFLAAQGPVGSVRMCESTKAEMFLNVAARVCEE